MTGGGRERRRFPRADETFIVQYRVAGMLNSSWSEATMLNLSAGGVRFRQHEPLEVGGTLSLQLKLPGSTEPIQLQGRVVWSSMHASGVFETGVEFEYVPLPQQTMIDQLISFLRSRL
jgi:hypothetical protein